MSILYERINHLCEENNVTAYKLCKDIGIRPSIITDLKNGRKKGLSAEYAEKISTYFGVSVSYLLGNDNKKTAAQSDSYSYDYFDSKTGTLITLDHKEKEILRLMRYNTEFRNYVSRLASTYEDK